LRGKKKETFTKKEKHAIVSYALRAYFCVLHRKIYISQSATHVDILQDYRNVSRLKCVARGRGLVYRASSEATSESDWA